MQIFITTPSGKQVTLDVEGGDRILVVKQKLSDKEGITPAQQVEAISFPAGRGQVKVDMRTP
jgi:hypothetical protein